MHDLGYLIITMNDATKTVYAFAETPYHQHPLPGAAFAVVATSSYWVVGELVDLALLRAADGSLVVAEQSAGCYHPDSVARVYRADGTYRQTADRSPMTEGQTARLRFTMDWSTARGAVRSEVAALFRLAEAA